eukprot:jgi/Hompol1/1730/HPOL_005041-RA
MDQLHNGAPPRAKWQKLLYIKQDYPDNYVDKSFLNLMKRNVNVRQLSFWNVVGESCRVSQQLSVITLFVAVFVHLYRDDETNSDPGISNSSINASTANKIVWEPLHLVIGSCIVTILLYLFWMYLAIQNASRSGTSDSFVPKTVSGVVLFFTMLMGLTPILKNLTKDISSDSIWFMTILMFIANMLFHDYGASFSTKASLAAWNVFLLPLDVANQSGSVGVSKGGIPIAQMTLAFYATSIIIVLIIMPFTVFYYEGEDIKDDPDAPQRSASGQLGYAIKWIIPVLLFFAGVIAAMYWGGLGYAEISTTYLQSPLFDTTDLETKSFDAFYSFQFYCNTSAVGKTITLRPRVPVSNGSAVPTYTSTYYLNTGQPKFGCESLSGSPICCSISAKNDIVVSVGVFIVAVVTLIGWVIFAVFGGVGMASLPYDMLNEFQHRPKPITSQEYAERKIKIGQQAQLLMEVCKTLNNELKEASRGNSFNRRYRTIKNRERQFRKQRGQAINPISPFLNDMLKMTAGVPVVGIVLYAMFTFYLLFCVLKGNQKLGMRLIFITVHPLQIGETLMSALVFNAGIILLCSLPLAQFCNTAFSQYAQYTSNQSIFGVSISTLKGISFGFDACVYLMLAFCGLTFFYNIYNPYKKQKENQLKFNW